MGEVPGPPRPPRRPDPEELSLSRAARLFARGLTLRCPNCGRSHLLAGWFRLKPGCPECGLRTDRGEEDFFLGGLVWNFAFSGLTFLALLVGVMLVYWPDVPWRVLQWGGVAFIAVLPFLFYPVSLTTWLATDILMKPVTEEELEWSRASAPGEFRRHRDR